MTAVNLPGVGIDGGAEFSPHRRYRYLLWRTWDPSKAPLLVVMLNPSIADEGDDDRTVEGLIRKASNLGYGGLRIVNLFGWISSVPARLLDVPDPVGPRNDEVIIREIAGARRVVCAWGSHAVIKKLLRLRVIKTLRYLQPVALYAFKTNTDGEPAHPLYLADETPLQPWPEETTDADAQAAS